MDTESRPSENSPVLPARYSPLLLALVPLAAGIAADRWLAWSVFLWWLAAALLLLVWAALWRRGREVASGALLAAALAATGAAWHHVRWDLFSADDLGRFAREEGEPVAVEAVAVAAPRRAPAPPFNPMRAVPVGDHSRIALDMTAIRDGAVWKPASGRAGLTVEGHLLGVRAGDRVRVFASLAAPMATHNPGEFDFAAFARGNRQLASLRADTPDCVSVIERGSWSLERGLDALRSRGDELLWRNLDYDRLGLAETVLLGNREQLDPEQNEAFLTTGTVHLLSISGLHVAILAWVLFAGLRLGLVPRGVALVTVPVVIWLYVFVAGSEPPAVRAGIMVSVGCVAMYFGRRALDVNTLAAAALVILALRPIELFRVGWQLSFLSVAALIWLAPRWRAWSVRDPLDRLIAESRPRAWRVAARLGRWLWQGTLVGLVIWLVTLPLVAANFHVVSPVGVLVNTLLAVPMTIAMAAGFGVLVLGWLFAPLGAVCGWLCDVSLAGLDDLVRAAARVPAGHFWTPGPAVWWIVGFYAGLAALVWLGRFAPPRRWCVALAAGWVGLGLVVPWARGATVDRLECDFVSVGHGGAELVRLPDGRTLLYDAGAMGSPAIAARSIAAYLWSCGITHLDAVVLSHADTDHYNALPDLLDRFTVGAVYVSPVMFRAPTAALDHLKSAIETAGVPLVQVATGDQFHSGGDCRLRVLHPPREGVPGSDNANSVVLSVEYHGRRVLLTGDLAAPGLNRLLVAAPMPCDVLLVPHHGSQTSDPAGLARWATPRLSVISGGYADDVSPTMHTYAAAGARVLHTATTGAVSVRIDGNRMGVETWRQTKQLATSD